ncbi:MAG: hypothetical protein MJ178_03340 [Treponemataceae bacterium]|nr:hypothetical protein [Treponemataceae bacterium]
METYCSELLTLNDNGIALDTGLSPREAAQSKLPQYLKENGYTARCTDGTWNFDVWTWDDTKTAIPPGRRNEAVFVTGQKWNGVPLYSLIEAAMAPDAAEPAFTRAVEALNRVNAAVEAAFAAGRELPLSGPAGILTGTGDNEGALLFLPSELFVRALQSRGEADRSRYAGIWVNEKLAGIDAWRFTLSACAFAVLYGTPAYGNLNTDLRIEDYLDKNHIPLHLCLAGQKKEVLFAIEHNIDQQGAVSKKARKAKNTVADAIIERETVNTSYSVPLPLLEPFSGRQLTDPETVPQWQAYKRKLKRTRFVRKYQNALKISAAALVAILIVAGTIIRDHRDAPSTAGLTRDEVIYMYYKGIDTLDTSLLDAARYKAGKGWSSYISTLFVTSKMRENYESIHTWTPGQWLWIRNPETVNVFGISNLQYEQIREYDDESADYRTDFYILQFTNSSSLSVTRYSGVITVGKVKKNFRITADDTKETELDIDLQQFITDLQQAADGQEAPAIVQALHAAYPWMPSPEDIQRGKDQLESGEYQ